MSRPPKKAPAKGKDSAADERRVDIEDGVYIFRRAGSKQGIWNLYAYVGGEEINRSLKTADRGEAIRLACQAVEEARDRKRRGKKAKTTTFEAVARRYLEEVVAKWPEGDRRTKFAHRIETYLIPHFGRTDIGAVTDKQVTRYADARQHARTRLIEEKREEHRRKVDEARQLWRSSPRIRAATPNPDDYLPEFSLGVIQEEVADSTINAELSMLRQIFEYAVDQDFISKADVPVISNIEGPEHQPRLGYERHEVEKIRRIARERFREAERIAVKRHIHKLAKLKQLDLSPDSPSIPYLERKLAMTGEGWVDDRTAWGRFQLMCVIDVLAGTGMRPSTLAGIRVGHVHDNLPAGFGRGEEKAVARPARPLMMDNLDLHDLIGAPGGEAEMVPKEARYVLWGQTAKVGRRSKKQGSKGQKPRQGYIVPERWCWPAIRLLLSHAPKDKRAPLVDISTGAMNQGIKKILDEVEIRVTTNDEKHCLYDLRHYYITQKLLAGVSLIKVAKNTMTSIQMIEKHYERLKTIEAFNELAGIE